jgi:hypothetical protein
LICPEIFAESNVEAEENGCKAQRISRCPVSVFEQRSAELPDKTKRTQAAPSPTENPLHRIGKGASYTLLVALGPERAALQE